MVRSRSFDGFSLVEALVALGVVALLIGCALGLVRGSRDALARGTECPPELAESLVALARVGSPGDLPADDSEVALLRSAPLVANPAGQELLRCAAAARLKVLVGVRTLDDGLRVITIRVLDREGRVLTAAAALLPGDEA